jgi:hypothetical protein
VATIYRAAESARRTLRAEGPEILTTNFKGLPRLQTQPGPNDKSGPHVEGRALDIVLLAERDSECAIADDLVARFLAFREEIGWNALIYNQEQWDSAGVKSPRILTERVANPGRDYEHKTHIHIQWPMHSRDLDVSYAVALALAHNLYDSE